MKIKKTKKSKKLRGNTTHGHGARKKWKKSGHKGGVGMAGSGKRGDQKKSLIIKLYGKGYFGKKGITSRKTEKKKIKIINLRNIERNYDLLVKKFGKGDSLELKGYRVLGDGEISKKLKIKAKVFTKSAENKIKKSGGEAILEKIPNKKEKTPKKEDKDSKVKEEKPAEKQKEKSKKTKK